MSQEINTQINFLRLRYRSIFQSLRESLAFISIVHFEEFEAQFNEFVSHVVYDELPLSDQKDIDIMRRFIRNVHEHILPEHWNLAFQFDRSSDKITFLDDLAMVCNFVALSLEMSTIQQESSRVFAMISLARILDELYQRCIQIENNMDYSPYERLRVHAIIRCLAVAGESIYRWVSNENSFSWPILKPNHGVQSISATDTDSNSIGLIHLDDLKIVEDADEQNKHMTFDQCCICLDLFQSNEDGVYPYTLHMQSRCLKHKFHHQCIHLWLEKSPNKCPCCRE